MKRILGAMVALSVTACGPGFYYCSANQQPASLEVDLDKNHQPVITCQKVQEQLDTAHAILLRDFPPPPVLGTINILYKDADAVGTQGGIDILGEFDNGYNVTLNWSGLALAHELLHVTGKYIYHDSDADNEAHTFWAQRGWWTLDAQYQAAVPALP